MLPTIPIKLIYYSYIHSHIVYLNPIWAGASLQKLNELYIFQKRAIKYIFNVHRMFPSSKLFLNDFRSLRYIIKEQLILFIYKITHNHIKHNYILIRRNAIHNYSTRGCDEYEIEFFHTDMRYNNVMHIYSCNITDYHPNLK